MRNLTRLRPLARAYVRAPTLTPACVYALKLLQNNCPHGENCVSGQEYFDISKNSPLQDEFLLYNNREQVQIGLRLLEIIDKNLFIINEDNYGGYRGNG
jgi:hypothetical protein